VNPFSGTRQLTASGAAPGPRLAHALNPTTSAARYNLPEGTLIMCTEEEMKKGVQPAPIGAPPQIADEEAQIKAPRPAAYLHTPHAPRPNAPPKHRHLSRRGGGRITGVPRAVGREALDRRVQADLRVHGAARPGHHPDRDPACPRRRQVRARRRAGRPKPVAGQPAAPIGVPEPTAVRLLPAAALLSTPRATNPAGARAARAAAGSAKDPRLRPRARPRPEPRRCGS